MSLRRLSLALFAAVALSASAGRANAQCGYGFGFGGYWDIGRLYGVLAQNVPYYAAFPPVYYSVPVPRTYGYSPFAYPPGVMTPEIESVEPLAIDNPFMNGAPQNVQAPPAAEPMADRTTSVAPQPTQPLVVNNPFFRPSAPAAAYAGR